MRIDPVRHPLMNLPPNPRASAAQVHPIRLPDHATSKIRQTALPA